MNSLLTIIWVLFTLSGPGPSWLYMWSQIPTLFTRVCSAEY